MKPFSQLVCELVLVRTISRYN